MLLAKSVDDCPECHVVWEGVNWYIYIQLFASRFTPQLDVLHARARHVAHTVWVICCIISEAALPLARARTTFKVDCPDYLELMLLHKQ